jgi:hypothetical protein
VKSANLSTFVDRPTMLKERAERLQSEMLMWLSGKKEAAKHFNGTFRSVINLYETDPQSNYNAKIKPGVRETYGVYIKRLIAHIGDLRIDHQDGRDLKRWFAVWRTSEDGDHLPRAKMVLAVLKAAISFGVACRYPGCREFQQVIREIEFPSLKSRTFAPTAQQIEAARCAARAAGNPSRALLYALVYDTTGRAFDFLGQWLPISDKKPSAILAYGKKWIGPQWGAIDENMMLTIKPTKTENTTEIEVTFDLSVCPMVMEEIANILPEARTGPLIVNEGTRLPYIYQTFRLGWNADFEAAGLPKGMWCRDLRAGGVTEGGKAGVSKDDRQKIAGHAKPKQTEAYDRDQVGAFQRSMKARANYRRNDK